ncbi:MAG: ABC transporter permease [Firmicutes bacterium HGW-Firmicutes-1]|jgi:raffinose/stachyose/melibiose transport system permease protein|nr:MAG: ABC transporter permease [Firmicutes bacterium HGW-Firmicutes-1]
MKHLRKSFPFFIAPALIAYILVVIIPFGMGIVYSFTDWKGAYVSDWWVGLKNYEIALTGAEFLYSLRLTLLFTLCNVIFVNVLAFTLALLVTRGFKGSNIFRTTFFLPNLIGGLILGYIWKFVFDVIFDKMLYNATFMEGFRYWLQDEKKAFWALVIVATWQMAGYMMIIYIAAIQNIPEELLEAADVDGAKFFKKLRHIIMPLVTQAFTVTIFLTLSNSFKLLDANLSLTNGEPGRTTELLALHIFKTGQEYGRYGLAQAQSIIFFFMIAVVTLVQVYFSKKKEIES